MSLADVALIVGMLGALTVVLSWVGHRSGDSARDVKLMLAVGASMMMKSGVLYAID